jgi:hypothetical protein
VELKTAPAPPGAAAPPDPRAGAAPDSAAPAPRAALSPRLGELVCALVVLLLALAPNSLLNGDGDTAHHLLAGSVILREGAVPRVDIFTWPNGGQPFLDWEWLAEALYAAANQAAGLNGVALLAATLIAAALYGLYRRLIGAGLSTLPALLVLLLAAVTSEIHWLARPHLFSLVLTVVALSILESVRAGRAPARRLAWLAPLMALWANLHAGFVVGIALCAAYGAGALIERATVAGAGASLLRRIAPAGPSPGPGPAAYGLALAAAVAAPLLNPYGPALYAHIAAYYASPVQTAVIVEYLPPNFTQPITWGFAVMLASATAVVLAAWRRLPPAHLGLLVVWAALALHAARYVLQFSVITPFLLAPAVAWLLDRAAARRPGRWWARYAGGASRPLAQPGLLLAAVVALAALAAAGGRLGPVQVLNAHWTTPPFPQAAVRWLQTSPAAPTGPMFNDMTWGGYMLYTLYPTRKVFIDSQQDAYGETLFQDYISIFSLAPGWDRILARYGVAWAIVPPRSPLARALQAQTPPWPVAYADGAAVILLRP